MHIKRFTTCLYVRDLAAASSFYVRHLGFTEELGLEYVVKLGHQNPAFELCFLPLNSQFAPDDLPEPNRGVIVVLEVDDAAAELDRLRESGVEIAAELQDEPWGERCFQVRDPNGVTVQLVQWLKPRPGSEPA